MKNTADHTYDDIINLPHHVSAVHPHMPASDRAAQFSPFAALTGHGAAIRETARLTETQRELDEDVRRLLDQRLQELRGHLAERPRITVCYFQPDTRKEGGAYVTEEGRVKGIDELGRELVFENGTRIPAGEICSIDGELFRQSDEV